MRIKHKTRRPTRKGGKGKGKTMKGGNKSTKDIIDDASYKGKNSKYRFYEAYPHASLIDIFTRKYYKDDKEKIKRDMSLIKEADDNNGPGSIKVNLERIKLAMKAVIYYNPNINPENLKFKDELDEREKLKNIKSYDIIDFIDYRKLKSYYSPKPSIKQSFIVMAVKVNEDNRKELQLCRYEHAETEHDYRPVTDAAIKCVEGKGNQRKIILSDNNFDIISDSGEAEETDEAYAVRKLEFKDGHFQITSLSEDEILKLTDPEEYAIKQYAEKEKSIQAQINEIKTIGITINYRGDSEPEDLLKFIPEGPNQATNMNRLIEGTSYNVVGTITNEPDQLVIVERDNRNYKDTPPFRININASTVNSFESFGYLSNGGNKKKHLKKSRRFRKRKTRQTRK